MTLSKRDIVVGFASEVRHLILSQSCAPRHLPGPISQYRARSLLPELRILCLFNWENPCEPSPQAATSVCWRGCEICRFLGAFAFLVVVYRDGMAIKWVTSKPNTRINNCMNTSSIPPVSTSFASNPGSFGIGEIHEQIKLLQRDLRVEQKDKLKQNRNELKRGG